MSQQLAPIALFVYNRLWHTSQTVESLLRNELAAESELYIYSDAPKDPNAVVGVRKVREYIKKISGFKSVTLILRDANFGLAASIVDGVTRLCSEHGRVIVLEDDLVTAPSFLKFMNDALDLYADTPEVMHISGCVYPIGELDSETFFFRVPLCWGWATWQDSWKSFDKSNDVISKFSKKQREEFNFNNSYHYWEQLELNREGKIDTWFIFWYASIFFKKGLSLFPSRSLVLNIGHDGSGVHCFYSDCHDVKLSKKPIDLKKIDVIELENIIFKHKKYYKNTCKSNLGSIANKKIFIKNYMRKIIKALLIGTNLMTFVNFVKYRKNFPGCSVSSSSIVSSDVYLSTGVVVSSRASVLSSKLGVGTKVLSHVALSRVVTENDVIFYNHGSFSEVEVGCCSYIASRAEMSLTKVGRFCSIGPSLICGYGDHPANWISTSPVFFSTRKQCGKTFVDRDLYEERKLIVIGNDVWIGARVFIRDGVTIGTGAIIAAGSVVVKDVPPYAIVGGVPAKVIRYRFTSEVIADLLAIAWWNWSEERLLSAQAYIAQADVVEFIKWANSCERFNRT